MSLEFSLNSEKEEHCGVVETVIEEGAYIPEANKKSFSRAKGWNRELAPIWEFRNWQVAVA